MFRQILVPTDFSEKHINPLEIAINLAEKYKSTIHLLHVVEIIPHTTFMEDENFYKKLDANNPSRQHRNVTPIDRRGFLTPSGYGFIFIQTY